MGNGLKERLRTEMTAALKGGERVRLEALRLLATAVKNREVEVGHELSDDEVRQVAAREARRRTEAIEAYGAAGREDLVTHEREQLEAIAAYLPERLSDAELDALIEEAIAATGASSPRELGKVMAFVMGRARGRVDGAAAQARVRARLET